MHRAASPPSSSSPTRRRCTRSWASSKSEPDPANSRKPTMTTRYLWTPPPVYSLPVRGSTQRLPVNRLFFVGRNYHAHAVEMGRPVDKAVERPFYFTKSPQTLVDAGATVPYPPETSNYHHEMELVVVIGQPGFRVRPDDAAAIVYGY